MTPSPDPMNSWRTALLFGGNSYVALTKPLPAMSAGVTIEFWAFGADGPPPGCLSLRIREGPRLASPEHSPTLVR